MATSRPPVQVCFSTTDFKTTSEERLNAVRSAIDDEVFRADEWCESEFQPSAEPSATASGSAHDIDTESSHKRASPLAAVLLNSAYRSSDNNNAVPCGIPAASSAFQQLPSEGFQIPIGEPQDLRSLDPADLFWQAYHNIGNLMICNCITIVSTHPLVLQHVRAAAEMLLCRHQALRCSINAAPIPGEMRPDLEKNQDATRDQPDSATHEGTNFASRLRSFFVDSAGSLCRSCRRRRKVYVWRDNRSSAYLDVAMAQGGDVDRERGTFETVEGEDWVKAMKFEQSVPFDTSRGETSGTFFVKHRVYQSSLQIFSTPGQATCQSVCGIFYLVCSRAFIFTRLIRASGQSR
ncbi:hypothetical protein BESB_005030 [Besnoitia besnoiti]|uniref:Uncharacterized protein n=1 Tax=Besnoitia besnoiti TaxID=94643 RepID=A0A2A9MQB3_BESBE|nr:hypothetical protein BESB_005030 [Besnoitia besnoiti]PFH38162.1 hypothetical protein BESB_005030 [Besnoitia besnoiti]